MWKGTQASVPSIAERPTDRAVSGGMARSTRTQLYRPVSWFSGLGTGSRPRWTALGQRAEAGPYDRWYDRMLVPDATEAELRRGYPGSAAADIHQWNGGTTRIVDSLGRPATNTGGPRNAHVACIWTARDGDAAGSSSFWPLCSGGS